MRRGALKMEAAVGKLDFGQFPKRHLRLAVSGGLRGPEKYTVLDLKRRRAQIRARRELGLI